MICPFRCAPGDGGLVDIGARVISGRPPWWTSLNTGYVFGGGLPEASWLDSYNLSTVGGWRTFVNIGGQQAIRQTGTITRFTFDLAQVSLIGVKLCVFRRTDTLDFTLVDETDEIPAASLSVGTNQVETSLSCRAGDMLAVKYHDDGGGSAIVPSSNITSAGLAYYDGDVTGSTTFTGISANYVQQLYCEVDPPALVVAGDSIARGAYLWDTHTTSTGYNYTLDYTNDPAYQIALNLSPLVTTQNHGRGSATWANVLADWIPGALATLPRVLHVHCGVNDVGAARAWGDVEDDMDAVLALVNAQSQPCQMTLSEITPWTGASDAQVATIRTFNANYAAWCSANNVPLVLAHDPFGQTRVATGELDDLLTAYDYGDGTHYNATGIAAQGAIVAAKLRSIVGQ
jgi:lysophospholipase L1-like esterase